MYIHTYIRAHQHTHPCTVYARTHPHLQMYVHVSILDSKTSIIIMVTVLTGHLLNSHFSSLKSDCCGQGQLWTGSSVDRVNYGQGQLWTGTTEDRDHCGQGQLWTGTTEDRDHCGQDPLWTGTNVVHNACSHLSQPARCHRHMTLHWHTLGRGQTLLC